MCYSLVILIYLISTLLRMLMERKTLEIDKQGGFEVEKIIDASEHHLPSEILV